MVVGDGLRQFVFLKGNHPVDATRKDFPILADQESTSCVNACQGEVLGKFYISERVVLQTEKADPLVRIHHHAILTRDDIIAKRAHHSTVLRCIAKEGITTGIIPEQAKTLTGDKQIAMTIYQEPL